MNKKPLKNGWFTKKNVIPVWIIFFVVLAVWIIALLLGMFIMDLVNDISKDHPEMRVTGILFAFGGGSTLFALIIAWVLSNKSVKLVNNINENLDRIAKGDFSTKVEYKTRNEYVMSVVNNFNKMLDQLNSVTVMKNDFISVFSHEFKTPMVSIKGYAELLTESKNLTPDDKECLDIIIKECDRLSRLASNVMLLSKLDSQSFVTSRQTFSLSGQIEDTIILLDGIFKEKNLTVETDLKSVKYQGDKDLIKEVWINLLVNAAKYSKPDGKIKVSAKVVDGKAVVTVEDNGVGMSEETLKKAFDRFYQADGRHSRGGLGLGLNICKRIAELCGGEIVAISELDRGTKITVKL